MKMQILSIQTVVMWSCYDYYLCQITIDIEFHLSVFATLTIFFANVDLL